MDRFLIAWRNYNVEEEGGSEDPIGDGHINEEPGNVEGMLYGMPSFLLGRIVDKDTTAPIEDACTIIFGIGAAKLTKTNEGGWFNVEENSQAEGIYLVLVFKLGYLPAIQSVVYAGEPRQATIEMKKLW